MNITLATAPSPTEKKEEPKYPYFVQLYKQNYILPFYHTEQPYKSHYVKNTPDNAGVDKTEFKGQLGLLLTLTNNLFWNKNISLIATFTQQYNWQLYIPGLYMREVTYDPSLDLIYKTTPKTNLFISVDHQSNGHGGPNERSWHRIIGGFEYRSNSFYTKSSVWTIFLKDTVYKKNNPNIVHYLGHTQFILSYKLKNLVSSIEIQNIESLLQRGYVQASLSYPIWNEIRLFTQYFNGYGQTLVEYDHKTQAFGLGFSLGDWL